MKTIYQYARSPYGVPEQCLPEIREFLQSVNQDCDHYGSEISRLKNQLEFLRTQHERAQQQAMALRSLLAPVHRLPNELLAQIFRWAFHLSASELWAYIEVNACLGLRLGPVIGLYLERSKQQLLTLHIELFQDSGDESQIEIFQRLANCSSRWKDVYLAGCMPSSQLRGLEFPALEALVLHTNEDEDLDMFRGALKLQTLIVREPKLIPNHEVLGRITNLAYSLDFRNLNEILELCSNLHTLEIRDFFLFNDVHLVGPPVILNLTSFYVVSSDRLWGALCSFTTPALTMLTLEHDSNEDLSGYETCLRVEQFLEHSKCSLTKLEVILSWTDKDVLDLLQRLPTLQELTVRELIVFDTPDFPRPITTSFVKKLHGYQGSPLPIVPDLRSLYLHVASTGFDHKSFVETILSR
ncbi:hypothetical protein GYMLUDRAFT_237193 [Collybiopsis luxurians FD-317 M1]|nr:hypothetical protein GYMLUDRAFT_237193 [Collybiopsis luxurians FD-317 M1]